MFNFYDWFDIGLTTKAITKLDSKVKKTLYMGFTSNS